jgi:SAM-dependent methyltransferase
MHFTECDRERLEIDFWRTSEHEGPGSTSLEPIIDKIKDAEVFLSMFRRYRERFQPGGRILELGAGHGWASCLVKHLLPGSHVITTDISPYSLESNSRWQRIFNAKPDEAYACNSYATREPDNSVDLIFCFAAAHHFSNHAKTFAELKRILKRNGAALYLYEPTCQRFIYPLAHRRVNNKRPEVPEDLLVLADIVRLATEAGLAVRIDYDTCTIRRGFVEGIYYRVLSRVPLLQRILPCTANVLITHRLIATGK